MTWNWMELITCVMNTCVTQLSQKSLWNLIWRDDFDCMTWDGMEFITCVMKTCFTQLTEDPSGNMKLRDDFDCMSSIRLE